MPVELPIFHDVPDHRYRVALDGAQLEVRLVYRDRTASWYLDLTDADGVALLRGRRLSPGGSPQAGMITGGPAGALVPMGADPYARNEIRLLYFSESELEDIAATDVADELPVELA